MVRAETIHDVLGNDALRYFLLREVVFGQDGNFTFEALVQRYNADLANGYGNLVSRTLAMITRYFGGGGAGGHGLPVHTRRRSQHGWQSSPGIWTPSISHARWMRCGNSSAPWMATSPRPLHGSSAHLRRRPAARSLADILYTCAESIRIITALVVPVLPDAAAKVWQQLGLGDIAQADLKNIAWGGLKPGTRLGEPAPLFPRAEKDTVTRMKEIEENRPQSALEQALSSIPTVRVEPPAASASTDNAAQNKPAEKADTTAPEAGPKPLTGARHPGTPAAAAHHRHRPDHHR